VFIRLDPNDRARDPYAQRKLDASLTARAANLESLKQGVPRCTLLVGSHAVSGRNDCVRLCLGQCSGQRLETFGRQWAIRRGSLDSGMADIPLLFLVDLALELVNVVLVLVNIIIILIVLVLDICAVQQLFDRR